MSYRCRFSLSEFLRPMTPNGNPRSPLTLRDFGGSTQRPPLSDLARSWSHVTVTCPLRPFRGTPEANDRTCLSPARAGGLTRGRSLATNGRRAHPPGAVGAEPRPGRAEPGSGPRREGSRELTARGSAGRTIAEEEEGRPEPPAPRPSPPATPLRATCTRRRPGAAPRARRRRGCGGRG